MELLVTVRYFSLLSHPCEAEDGNSCHEEDNKGLVRSLPLLFYALLDVENVSNGVRTLR